MDKEKNILIFMNEKDLKPTGGPAGYLYNLKQALINEGIKNVKFLKGATNVESSKLKRLLKSKVPDNIKKYYINYKLIDSIANEKKAASMDLSEYDIVHFHTTYSLYMNRDNLSNFKGKVLLTSHSPKPAHREITEDQLSDTEKILYSLKLRELEKIDFYAFNRADHIIFPCKEAEEPYYNNWDEYKNIQNTRNDIYKYVPTGAIKCKAKRSRKDILEEYSIPSDSFVISYVGRHNETKGYDLLKKIGQKILEKHKNVYFLIAGKEEPLKGIDNKRWIEVGWTNDPHSIISTADLFILPNKETYFDLILLEVLSLGKVVLASDTGGNKYFKKFKDKGLFYFNDEEDALLNLEDIINLSNEKVRELEEKNEKLFDENFTMSHFTKKYLEVVNEIFKE